MTPAKTAFQKNTKKPQKNGKKHGFFVFFLIAFSGFFGVFGRIHKETLSFFLLSLLLKTPDMVEKGRVVDSI